MTGGPLPRLVLGDAAAHASRAAMARMCLGVFMVWKWFSDILSGSSDDRLYHSRDMQQHDSDTGIISQRVHNKGVINHPIRQIIERNTIVTEGPQIRITRSVTIREPYGSKEVPRWRDTLHMGRGDGQVPDEKPQSGCDMSQAANLRSLPGGRLRPPSY